MGRFYFALTLIDFVVDAGGISTVVKNHSGNSISFGSWRSE
jgi:hypothetical protein